MQVQYEPWAEKDSWGFRFIEGKYKDTTINISNVELTDGGCLLEFSFVNKTTGLEEGDFSSEEFNLNMTEILNDILKKATDEYKDRDSNSTESYLQ